MVHYLVGIPCTNSFERSCCCSSSSSSDSGGMKQQNENEKYMDAIQVIKGVCEYYYNCIVLLCSKADSVDNS